MLRCSAISHAPSYDGRTDVLDTGEGARQAPAHAEHARARARAHGRRAAGRVAAGRGHAARRRVRRHRRKAARPSSNNLPHFSPDMQIDHAMYGAWQQPHEAHCRVFMNISPGYCCDFFLFRQAMLTYTPAQVEATAAFAHAALGLVDAGARAPGLFAFPARRRFRGTPDLQRKRCGPDSSLSLRVFAKC